MLIKVETRAGKLAEPNTKLNLPFFLLPHCSVLVEKLRRVCASADATAT